MIGILNIEFRTINHNELIELVLSLKYDVKLYISFRHRTVHRGIFAAIMKNRQKLCTLQVSYNAPQSNQSSAGSLSVFDIIWLQFEWWFRRWLLHQRSHMASSLWCVFADEACNPCRILTWALAIYMHWSVFRSTLIRLNTQNSSQRQQQIAYTHKRIYWFRRIHET